MICLCGEGYSLSEAMDISGQLQRKERFKRFLKDRFSLRFHMFLILTGTALAGLLATKVLLLFNVTSMLIRYPIAVVFAYLAFFGFVKLWLTYLSSLNGSRRVARDITESAADIPHITDFPVSGPPSPVSFRGGGGGHFGGGGASGAFDGDGDIVHQTSEVLVPAHAESAGSGAADAAGRATGDAASSILENAGIVLVILGILLALVFGAGAYHV